MDKSYEQLITDLAKQKNIITPKDLRAKGIPTIYLTRMVKAGKLERLRRGIYALPNRDFGEKQSIAEISKLVPNAVICLLSALRFHELTTQNPREIWIAVQRESDIPLRSWPSVRVLRMSHDQFAAGIQHSEIEGIEIRVYSPAKTVADCFKYRNKVGLDVALEALRDAWRQRKVTMDELWHYAKICRMSKVMRPYLESLV
ncbi:MAG TPA: type IV toxin-antitoxin system AbiEi family antitoxin domain-containing protein [Aridibacter sp.]|nr:type IV toxin-antitoxin system AbiEi family antitoxin domain-containing protein [Aridibacter sp.]